MNQKESEEKRQVGLNISVKAFLGAVLLLVALIILAGVLTRVLPQGSYDRQTVNGNTLIVPGSYREIQASPLPLWRWATAPFEVLASPDSAMAIGVMAFLILIGGTFYILDKCGMLRHVMGRLINRFAGSKYKMLALLAAVFMAMGSMIGVFEEAITLVPIAVAISYSMGWDALVGLGISSFAVAVGFAAGTFNPFTVGVVQNIAELPMYSGLWLRAVIFLLAYGAMAFFLLRYARRIEADPSRSLLAAQNETMRAHYSADVDEATLSDPRLKKSVRVFCFILLGVFCYILAGFFIKGLTDYTLIVMALGFTAGGFAVGKISRYGKSVFKDFCRGMLSVLPAVLMILLAMGVKQVITAGGVLDTILYRLSSLIQGQSAYASALLIYAIVLVFNALIGSASAKGFLLMPLLTPLADMAGVTRQTAVLAFVLGDGFSNVIYPTNAALLVMLGLAGVSWGKWFRWTWKFQLAMLIMSIGAICLAVTVGY